MKIGIVGYGNVGKALKICVESIPDWQLIGVFSRRKLSLDGYIPFEDLAKYRDKIDLLLVALGSYDDICANVESFVGFDTVDCFDTHGKIGAYKALVGKLNNKNLSIVATGWDPGLLSLLRALFCFDAPPTTLWGQGVSQGHSNAIRSIPEVIDAVQFTIPTDNAIKVVQGGENSPYKLHKRICYVACVQSAKQKVEEQIKRMPHYFDGYDTKVVFCTPQEVRKQKLKTSHKGKVVAFGREYSCTAEVSMQNNAMFTAKIMIRYAKLIPKLKQDGYLGAVDVLDIPLRYLTNFNVL